MNQGPGQAPKSGVSTNVPQMDGLSTGSKADAQLPT